MTSDLKYTFSKNGQSPASFCLFSSFQTNITFFTTNKCETCPSSIWCWDSKPRPSEHESPPITTRPGLPPKVVKLFVMLIAIKLTLRSDRMFCLDDDDDDVTVYIFN